MGRWALPIKRARIESHILRFLLFLEADGRNWVYAGPYDVMAYLGDLYRGGTVGGIPVAGYASAINSFCSRIGVPAPRLILPSALHPVVKGAMERYRSRYAIHEPSAGPAGATEIDFIHTCAAMALTAMARGDWQVSRAFVVQVSLFYLFGRPTSNLCILGSSLLIQGRQLHVTRPSLGLARKNKKAASLVLKRRCLNTLPPAQPLAALARYTRFSPRHSEYLFCHPSENRKGAKCPNSANLLSIAVAAVAAPPDPGRTPHAHRRGAATAVYKFGVPRPT
jgi:hypothetical protein